MSDAPVRLGIIGLGMAGAMMVRAAATHPGIVLAACADPRAEPREAFARDFAARAYDSADSLCGDATIEAVYIATPHQYHADQAILAAESGKHVVVEKPLALTLAECDRVIDAVERAGVQLIVGHTHAFDPTPRAMRRLIVAGEIGRLGMIACWNYTNFLYRPRRPEELDTQAGGGIVFNQLPHQIDMVRLLAGGLVTSVRARLGVLDPQRPTEGSCAALLQLAGGAVASLVYSGYDFFDSDELHFWVSEGGVEKRPAHGAARRALAAASAPEPALRGASAYGAVASPGEQTHLPHFGSLIVTGSRAELRPSADGILIYDHNGMREASVARGSARSGHGDVLQALYESLRLGRISLHDARWGKATLEVALALLQSSREEREIVLAHQVAVPAGA